MLLLRSLVLIRLNFAGVSSGGAASNPSSGSSFDNFINNNTSTPNNGVNRLDSPISNTTFTSTQTNVGGSIYVSTITVFLPVSRTRRWSATS